MFLFLTRGIDGGLLAPLSALALQQANLTENTMRLTKQFLDYMAMQEEAVLTYRTSDMVLGIHSNASYLSEAKAQSQAGGHMFMTGKDEIPRNNRTVLNILQIIHAVMSFAAKADLGALFANAKTEFSYFFVLQFAAPNKETRPLIHSALATCPLHHPFHH